MGHCGPLIAILQDFNLCFSAHNAIACVDFIYYFNDIYSSFSRGKDNVTTRAGTYGQKGLERCCGDASYNYASIWFLFGWYSSNFC